MSPTEFNYLMQNLVRNDPTRDGNLLLEVMDEDTYRSVNNLPSLPLENLTTDRHSPTRSGYDSTTDEVYPKMRQCFIRVRLFVSLFFLIQDFFFCLSLGQVIVNLVFI